MTYRIVERVLFSASSADDLSVIESAITVALHHTYRQIELGGLIPAWLPTPANLAFRKAVRTLDHRVFELIENHRRDAVTSDLLSMLLAARDHATQRAVDYGLQVTLER